MGVQGDTDVSDSRTIGQMGIGSTGFRDLIVDVHQAQYSNNNNTFMLVEPSEPAVWYKKFPNFSLNHLNITSLEAGRLDFNDKLALRCHRTKGDGR